MKTNWSTVIVTPSWINFFVFFFPIENISNFSTTQGERHSIWLYTVTKITSWSFRINPLNTHWISNFWKISVLINKLLQKNNYIVQLSITSKSRFGHYANQKAVSLKNSRVFLNSYYHLVDWFGDKQAIYSWMSQNSNLWGQVYNSDNIVTKIMKIESDTHCVCHGLHTNTV